MTGFPGLRPIHGDSVRITTSTGTLLLSGSITVQGVNRDGRGFAELTLPDADPQQRRELERSERFEYELYSNGAQVYASPSLVLRETRRTKDGSLVLCGTP